MVVKGPSANRLVRRVRDVFPSIAGSNLVAAPPRLGPDAKRPGPVRIDAVAKPMQVKTVTVRRVAVENVNVQALAGIGIEDTSRNPAVPRRFVHVGSDQLRRIRLRVVAVEVLVVNESVERRRHYFARLDSSELVAGAEHVVPAPATRAWSRRER